MTIKNNVFNGDHTNYLMNKRYCLLFFYHFDGYPISEIPNFITDDRRSVVISARCSALSSNHERSFHEYKIKSTAYLGEIGKIRENATGLDIFLWFNASPLNDRKNFLRLNRKEKFNIRYWFDFYSIQKFNSGLFLLDMDNFPEDDMRNALSKVFASCLRLKFGGPELVAEFLLSDFIEGTGHYSQFNLLPDQEVFAKYNDNSHNPDIMSYDFIKDKLPGLMSPLFEFGLNSNLDHLTSHHYIEHQDFDGDYYEQNIGPFIYFNLDLNLVKQIGGALRVPERVAEILEPHQISILKKTAPDYLISNLVTIFNIGFSQYFSMPVLSNVDDSTHVSSDLWGQDMYDSLGGNGGDSVYLSDGMSLNPDGSIDED
jgi:hypothetical protein